MKREVPDQNKAVVAFKGGSPCRILAVPHSASAFFRFRSYQEISRSTLPEEGVRTGASTHFIGKRVLRRSVYRNPTGQAVFSCPVSRRKEVSGQKETPAFCTQE